MKLSGPMFEPSKSGPWESVHKKSGAHCNIYGCDDEDGMDALKEMFPDAKADELNFCLFSTSGVHGLYRTIEESYNGFKGLLNEYGYEEGKSITFLIVHPRICCLRYGNCEPRTEDDYLFLKKLRQSSWDAVKKIGSSE